MLTKIPISFWRYARSMSQFLLLVRMTLWLLILRLLRPIFSLKRLIDLITPKQSKEADQPQDVMKYLGWFNYLNLYGNSGGCLTRALLSYRFLTSAGVEPKLFIGFDGREGHAWIEHSGKIVQESQQTINQFTPVLVLHPGNRTLKPLLESVPATLHQGKSYSP